MTQVNPTESPKSVDLTWVGSNSATVIQIRGPNPLIRLNYCLINAIYTQRLPYQAEAENVDQKDQQWQPRYILRVNVGTFSGRV